MRASDVIKILSICPDAEVTVWSNADEKEMQIDVSTDNNKMRFCIHEA